MVTTEREYEVIGCPIVYRRYCLIAGKDRNGHIAGHIVSPL